MKGKALDIVTIDYENTLNSDIFIRQFVRDRYRGATDRPNFNSLLT